MNNVCVYLCARSTQTVRVFVCMCMSTLYMDILYTIVVIYVIVYLNI